MPPRWSEGLASLTTVLWLHSTDFVAGALLSRPLDAVWGPLTLQTPPLTLISYPEYVAWGGGRTTMAELRSERKTILYFKCCRQPWLPTQNDTFLEEL